MKKEGCLSSEMWNEPSPEELNRLPRLYSTENTPPQDKIIHMHFFLEGCDWYAAEYSPDERIFYGYAILNNDLENSEWGYFSFDELRSARNQIGIEVDRDLHWQPRKAGLVGKIRVAQE